MTSIALSGQRVRNELALLRRLAVDRRLASARMPNVQRSGLVHGPFARGTPRFSLAPKRDQRAV